MAIHPRDSCLGNPMDRGAWWATVYEVAKRVGHDLVMEQQQQWFGCTFYAFQKLLFFLCTRTHTHVCILCVCVCVCTQDERLSNHFNIWGSR